MTDFIDRRKQGGKHHGNEKRLKERLNDQIREAVQKDITGNNVTNKRDGVSISAKGLHEPRFRNSGGKRTYVSTGNPGFSKGDKIERSEGGGGTPRASNQGEGEDEFFFKVSREEYLRIFFDDLALPNFLKRHLIPDSTETIRVPSGITHEGIPARRHLLRTFLQSKGRHYAYHRKEKLFLFAELLELRIILLSQKDKEEREREETKKELENLLLVLADQQKNEILREETSEEVERCESRTKELRAERQQIEKIPLPDNEEKKRFEKNEDEIEDIRRILRGVPFIDPMDEMFRQSTDEPMPVAQAVMFCLMDISGSMDEKKKDLAKRFFLLLYLFLIRTYGPKKVQVIFIRHHTTAKEVDEEEFFQGRETGGTIASSALRLMKRIVDKRFPPSQWNIYAAQASDGDNWPEDSFECRRSILEDILPIVQYFAYIQVGEQAEHNQENLWRTYDEVKQSGLFEGYFDMGVIMDEKQIYPVFRELFKKETGMTE